MGRTGTALACLAVLDGVPADEAVAFVRAKLPPPGGGDTVAATLRTELRAPLSDPPAR